MTLPERIAEYQRKFASESESGQAAADAAELCPDLCAAYTAAVGALKSATKRADRIDAALDYINQHKTSASHACCHLAEIERRLKGEI